MVKIRKYTTDEFYEYLVWWKNKGSVVKATFLHHTATSQSSYKGLSTIEGFRKFHINVRKFRDIACNAYTAPDGAIYNARPPDNTNCACQAPETDSKGRPSVKWPVELYILSKGDLGFHNKYGFGVETIGNYDVEDPKTSVAMQRSLDVLAMVHHIWNIPVEHCFFHRDVANKTCPGSRVSREWVHNQLKERLSDMSNGDVSAWAKFAVEEIINKGLMSRYADGSFRGGDPVTREQLAVVLYRLIRSIEDKTK